MRARVLLTTSLAVLVTGGAMAAEPVVQQPASPAAVVSSQAEDFAVNKLTLTGVSKGQLIPGRRDAGLRFSYEGAKPDDFVLARWIRTGEKDELVGEARANLPRQAGKMEVHLSPLVGGTIRWTEGAYRVELVHGEDVLATLTFRIGAEAARAVDDLAAKQEVVVRKPEEKAPGAQAAKTEAAAVPPVEKKSIVPSEEEVAGKPVLVRDVKFVRDIAGDEPKGETGQYSTARRRLLMWTNLNGGETGGSLTVRWFSAEGEEMGASTQEVGPGEHPVAFWLEVTDPQMRFPAGEMKVALITGGKIVMTLPLRIRQASLGEDFSESLSQFGTAFGKSLRREPKLGEKPAEK